MRKSKKDRQHNGQKILKGVIRIRKSKKDRQHNGQRKSTLILSTQVSEKEQTCKMFKIMLILKSLYTVVAGYHTNSIMLQTYILR